MSEVLEDLARRLVAGRKRDGRCVYDEQAKAELVAECAKPGASVSRLAREGGVNANQLSRWIREQERPRRLASAAPRATAEFVAVAIAQQAGLTSAMAICVQARMPNGVNVELQGCDLAQVCRVIEALGGMRCSALMKS